MKRIIVGLVLVASMATFGFAEYAKKGTFEFGGTAGYTSSTYSQGSEDVKITTLSLVPELFYFVSDNWALGAAVKASQTTLKTGSGSEVNLDSTSLLLEPMYVFKGQGMYPYAGLLLGLISDESYGPNFSTTEFGVQAGIKVPVVKNGLMNAGFRYMMGNGTVEDVDVDVNDLALSIGFSLFI